MHIAKYNMALIKVKNNFYFNHYYFDINIIILIDLFLD